MHLLEQYALSCGVKIDKPIIYDSYFPIDVEKYICFHPVSKYDSKTYDNWQIVIDMIHPFLEREGIKILQIGAKNEKAYNHCTHLQGATTLNQVAYLIKNSMLNLGADSFSAHFASGYGKKIVALYSNNNINNVKPYWSNEEDCVLIEPDRNGSKPNYCEKESPKSINNIKPERIANAVLKLLRINNIISTETFFIGDKYSPSRKFLEIVPNGLVDPKPFNVDVFNVRMDLHFSQENLFKQSQISKVNIITDKAIDLNLIKSIKNNVMGVLYILKDEDDPDFVKRVIDLGISLQIASDLDNDKKKNKKINYMDIGAIGQIVKRDMSNFKGKKFKSSKCIISEGKIYPSTHFYRINKPAPSFDQHVFEFDNAEDDMIESDFFYIFQD